MISGKIQIGVSSCLLGNAVRYDGKHKHNRFITDSLGQYFEYHAFCPEVAIGMGIPRAPIQLRQLDHGIRAIEIQNANNDFTPGLRQYARDSLSEIVKIAGYIFKKDSPSCGVARVKLFDESGQWISENGIGVFADEIIRAYPLLPVEEEDSLIDFQRRENFVERICVMDRWHKLHEQGLSLESLSNFHHSHRLNLLARGEAALQELDNVITYNENTDIESLGEKYITGIMQVLRILVTHSGHTQVMSIILHDLEQQLRPEERQLLQQSLQDYRQKQSNLGETINRFRQIVTTRPFSKYSEQYYLQAHPVEMMCRGLS